jgi:hypothetical protein
VLPSAITFLIAYFGREGGREIIGKDFSRVMTTIHFRQKDTNSSLNVTSEKGEGCK